MIHEIGGHFDNGNILAVLFVEEICGFTADNAAADNDNVPCIFDKLGIFKNGNCLSGFGVLITGKLECDVICADGNNNLVIACRLDCFEGSLRC